jgi:ketosteroid isomerase-like protein
LGSRARRNTSAYAESVEIRAPGTALDGRDDAAAWINVFLRAFPDLRHEVLTYTDAGDGVAIAARLTATHTGRLASPTGDIPPTGNVVSLDYADLFRFEDGLIRREQVYFDQMTFLGQLGLLAS